MPMGPIEAYLRDAAARRGIDPEIAVRVARSEGGLDDPFRRGAGPAPKSQAAGLGATENSFGPLQLYVSGTGAGLGDRAMAAGIDPSKNWKGGVDYALDEVRNKGWGQWYGAKNQGITGMMGVGGQPYRADPKDPQSAIDAASPGNTAVPVPSSPLAQSPVQGPPMPPSMSTPGQDAPAAGHPLREALSNAIGGFQMPQMATGKVDMSALAMPKASRIDTPDVPTFDQNAIANQRQQLAMAMQRLNSGKLY